MKYLCFLSIDSKTTYFGCLNNGESNPIAGLSIGTVFEA